MLVYQSSWLRSVQKGCLRHTGLSLSEIESVFKDCGTTGAVLDWAKLSGVKPESNRHKLGKLVVVVVVGGGVIYCTAEHAFSHHATDHVYLLYH